MLTKTHTTAVLLAAATPALAQPHVAHNRSSHAEAADIIAETPRVQESPGTLFLSVFGEHESASQLLDQARDPLSAAQNSDLTAVDSMWWESLFDNDHLRNPALSPAWLRHNTQRSFSPSALFRGSTGSRGPGRLGMHQIAASGQSHALIPAPNPGIGRMTAVAGQPAIPTSGSAATVCVGLALMMSRRRR